MQPISRELVSAPESRRRFAALLPLGVGALVVGAIAAGVRHLEEIVEVGWFGHADQAYFAPLAARWVTVFVVSLTLYGIALGVGAIAADLRRNPAVEWVISFLGFLTLLSWLVSLHFIIVTDVARGHSGAELVPDEAHLLLVSSLVSLLWPVAFRLRADLRTIRALLMASLVSLGLALIVLDPYILEGWPVALGLRKPLLHVVTTDRFLWGLPYLAPLGPILWSSFVAWRKVQN
jgi:hypothetical protein